MRRPPLILLALLFLAIPASAQNVNVQKVQVRITSATTTTLVAAVAGTTVSIFAHFIYLEGGGTATNVKLQDTAGTNLLPTNSTVPLPNVGACWCAPLRGRAYYNPTASGAGLQIVTDAAGPVDVVVEYVK